MWLYLHPDDEFGVTDLAARVGVPLSTLHRDGASGGVRPLHQQELVLPGFFDVHVLQRDVVLGHVPSCAPPRDSDDVGTLRGSVPSRARSSSAAKRRSASARRPWRGGHQARGVGVGPVYLSRASAPTRECGAPLLWRRPRAPGRRWSRLRAERGSVDRVRQP